MDFGPSQLGKILIIMGSVIVVLGLLMVFLSRFGLFRLPGDFQFGSGNWRVYFPLATSIIISVVLTLILMLISYFRRQ